MELKSFGICSEMGVETIEVFRSLSELDVESIEASRSF